MTFQSEALSWIVEASRVQQKSPVIAADIARLTGIGLDAFDSALDLNNLNNLEVMAVMVEDLIRFADRMHQQQPHLANSLYKYTSALAAVITAAHDRMNVSQLLDQ